MSDIVTYLPPRIKRMVLIEKKYIINVITSNKFSYYIM